MMQPEETAMATIHHETTIARPAAEVWAAVRDYGALPDLVPGFVVATEILPDNGPPVRRVTFADGNVLDETIVAVDDARQRLVWSIRGPGVDHHNGAAQVIAEGGGTRMTWTADVLPDSLADAYSPLMQAGLATMAEHLRV